MKKYLDFVYLLAPAVVWWLSSVLLGDAFTLPNRLMLAVLCTAAGAGAMLTNRKLPGAFSLVAGLGMLASVPGQHEVPESALMLRLAHYDLSHRSGTGDTGLDALIRNECADLITLQADAATAIGNVTVSKDFPYGYASCTQGRSVLSRHPLLAIRESVHLGGTTLSGQLQAGDSSIGFVVMDLSGLSGEAEARNFIGKALENAPSASVALIDTGATGPRIPLEWITYTTGYAKSQQPWSSFAGALDGVPENNRQMVLFSPKLRCRVFEQTAAGIPNMQGTYAIGG